MSLSMSASMSQRRARVTAAVVLIVVLAAGLFAGVALERWRNPNPFIGPGVMGGALLNVAAGIPKELTRLQLSDTQTRQVQEILQRGRIRAGAVFNAVLPRLASATDSTDTEIWGVLSERQRAELGVLRRSRQLLVRVRRDSTGARHVDTIPASALPHP